MQLSDRIFGDRVQHAISAEMAAAAGWLHRSIGQTLQGSFSAVPKPNFASKYSLESSRRDLHNALLCTVLESNPQNQENRGEKRTWF